MGMIANSGELKKKDGVTYSSRAFRAEFSELFKESRKFDDIGADRFQITLCDEKGNEIDYRSFRTAWQTKDKYRKKATTEDFPSEGTGNFSENSKKNKENNVFLTDAPP